MAGGEGCESFHPNIYLFQKTAFNLKNREIWMFFFPHGCCGGSLGVMMLSVWP